MKTYSTTPAYELGELARFLEEHPGFSPLLTGDDGILCGFRIGECVLSIAEVQALCSERVELAFGPASRPFNMRRGFSPNEE